MDVEDDVERTVEMPVPVARGGQDGGGPATRSEGTHRRPIEVSTRVTPLEVYQPPQDGQDCLVVIYSSAPRQFGKRYMLGDESLSIGRGHENRVVLDNDSVSRRHCLIERRSSAWYVVDLESTNGTYVHDVQVTEVPLDRGDQVKVGDTILKFLSGSDIEAQYHETIYNMTIVDGLTQLHNKRFFIESLEREIVRAHGHARPLSLLMFDIDHFKHINDNFGHLAGDSVLRELGDLARIGLRVDHTVARYGGEEFAVLLPETSGLEAAQLAEDLRRRVQEHAFVFEGEALAVMISIGCAELEPDQDMADFLAVADENLYAAKRGGRNAVVASSPGAPSLRRTLDGQTLVHKLLAADGACTLVGFEIAEEVALMAALGVKVRDEWLRELELLVDEELPADGFLGRWQERYVLAGVRTDSAESMALADRVRERWESAEGSDDRRLRSAMLSSEELRSHHASALEQLAVRLLGSAPEVAAGDHATLPFPLAASAAWVESATSELHRLSALVHAIEIHLQLAVATAMALMSLEDAAPELLQTLRTSQGRPFTMGHWRELLSGFSAAGGKSNHPGARWLQGFRKKVELRGERLHLLEHVNRAVGVRNETVGHGAPMAEEAYAGDADYLHEVLRALLRAAEPLAASRLVSVAGADVLADDEDIEYEFRLHTGPSEIFPIRRERHSERLGRNWVYLLSDGHSPLSLSPVAFCSTCDSCRRTEIFFASGIALGPKGAIVKADGVTTNHRAQLEVQWSSHARALYDAVMTAR